MNEEDLPLGATTIQGVLDALPHGSGIDCDWTFEVVHAEFVIFRNSFHRMDEDGYYDGWCDFWIKVKKVRTTKGNHLKGPCEGKVQILQTKGDWDWRLYLDRQASRRVVDYGLKGYLEETIAFSLEKLGLSHKLRTVTLAEWEAMKK